VRPINHIVVHHSASPLTTTALDIDAWHEEKGWEGAGYHLIVEATGQLILGRPIHRVGAHCRGIGNSFGIGVCLVGDNTTETDRWTDAQIRTLGLLYFVLGAIFPDAEWLGHRDMPDTATLCPGLDVRALLGISPSGSATVTA
jgi:N-acetylmuramoyl-L-alanine amidase